MKSCSRSTSSITGSSDFAEAIGININCSHDEMFKVLEKTGIGFFSIENQINKFDNLYGGKFYAPHVLSFGLPGLMFPKKPNILFYGLAHPNISLSLKLFNKFNFKNVFVVSSTDDGVHFLDELNVFGTSKVVGSIDGVTGEEKSFKVNEILSLENYKRLDIAPSLVVEENIKLGIRSILGKDKNALRDMVCVNAGTILFLANKVSNLKEGYLLAAKCLKESSLGKTLDGGFSSHVLVSNSNIYKIKEKYKNIKELEKYTLTDSLACIIHSLNIIKNKVKGKKVCIVGDGAVGELTARYVNFLKSEEVTIIGKNLLDITNFNNINYNDIDLTKKYLDHFDIVIDCVGGESDFVFKNSSKIIKTFGLFIITAVYKNNKEISFIPRDFFAKEIKIYGSRSYITNKRIDEFKKAFDLISLKKISLENIITHRLPMSCFEEGIKTFTNKKKTSCRKLIFYNI